MKKLILSLFAVLLSCSFSFSQTTAQDWTKTDCSGYSHHLFADLDAGKCVILAYDMMPTCQMCIDAAHVLEPVVNAKRLAHPNDILFYCLGYTGTYSCATMNSWETSNGFDHDALFTQGTDVSYYGGMGMPTIVVLGNYNHRVYWKKLGITASDATAFGNAIDMVFSNLTVIPENVNASNFNVFPNPANNQLTIQFDNPKATSVSLQIVSLSGKLVQEIYNGEISEGLFEQSVNRASLSAGMYFLKVTSEGVSSYSKISIVN